MNYKEISSHDKTLRPYQQQSKEKIFSEWDNHDSILFQMPTGTGKTRLFTSIIHDINSYSIKNKIAVKILIVAHRTELIDQIHHSLEKYRVPYGIIMGSSEREYKKPVQVASIQTFSNKFNTEAQSIKFDFVIIDEAHHAEASSYRKLWDLNPSAKFLGVTATPWRMNNNGFTDLFNILIESDPVKSFIKGNYLSDYKYISIKDSSPIMKDITNIEDFDIEGDYKLEAMSNVLDNNKIRAQLYKSYEQYAKGLKGIIYAINREHSKHICEDYKAKGVKIAQIDSKTPKTERETLVSAFKNGTIQILVNVDIFSEGFDCPDIDFVQMARPTKSLAKYLQQVGRALRVSETKKEAILLDNVGMYFSFGLPDVNRNWNKYFNGVTKGTRGQKGVVYEHTNPKYISYKEGAEQMVVIRDVEEEILEKMRNRPLYWETDEGAMVLYNENSFSYKSTGTKYPDKPFDRFYNRLVEDKSNLAESFSARTKVGSRHLRIEKLKDSYTYILAVDRYDNNYVLYRTKDKVSLIEETFAVLRVESEQVQFIELNYRNLEDYVSYKPWDSPINTIKDVRSLYPKPLVEKILLSAPKGTDLYSNVTEWEKKKRSIIFKKEFSFDGKNYYWILSGTIMYTFDEDLNLIGKGDYSESIFKKIQNKVDIVTLPMSNRYVITSNDVNGIYLSIVDSLIGASKVFLTSKEICKRSFSKSLSLNKIDNNTCSFCYETKYDQIKGHISFSDDNHFVFSQDFKDDVTVDLKKMEIIKVQNIEHESKIHQIKEKNKPASNEIVAGKASVREIKENYRKYLYVDLNCIDIDLIQNVSLVDYKYTRDGIRIDDNKIERKLLFGLLDDGYHYIIDPSDGYVYLRTKDYINYLDNEFVLLSIGAKYVSVNRIFLTYYNVVTSCIEDRCSLDYGLGLDISEYKEAGIQCEIVKLEKSIITIKTSTETKEYKLWGNLPQTGTKFQLDKY